MIGGVQMLFQQEILQQVSICLRPANVVRQSKRADSIFGFFFICQWPYPKSPVFDAL